MTKYIKAGSAMLKVLESWGVKRLYGLPGGSFNSIMAALYERRDSIDYIQVRHEEVGALAAAAEAKLTGRVGVCFGTAGPGATHLFNGLYDAMMDRAPVVALVGQVVSSSMNYDAFQELNENPMFADVSIYNRTVMNPQSLPHVVDEALRRAYERKSVAVVTIPVDYGLAEIPDLAYSSAGAYRQATVLPDEKDVAEAVKLIEAAERPVLFAGQGARGAGEDLLALSRHYSMPIVLSVPAKGLVADEEENFLGMAARLSTKPANEALAACDLIVFIGSDFPFARAFFPAEARFVQVDIESSKLGRRHQTDAAILGDAGETMRLMVKLGARKEPGPFFRACLENSRNWRKWQRSFEDRGDVPLRAEPIFKEINRIAEPGAIFVTDVGNSTILAVRLLNLNGRDQLFTTSGWFATMGYGVPGGIAAALEYPERQVFTLNGDGAFAMVMQDIITQVKYGLKVINVVFSNDSLGFIEAEQEDTGQDRFGVLLAGADMAKAGEAMGVKGFSVTRPEELPEVFDQAKRAEGPVVIDVKIDNKRPFPAEAMILDPEKYSAEEIEAFKKRYEVNQMPLLKELMAAI